MDSERNVLGGDLEPCGIDPVNNRIRTIEGVRSTETFVYLELSKQTYTWGTR